MCFPTRGPRFLESWILCHIPRAFYVSRFPGTSSEIDDSYINLRFRIDKVNVIRTNHLLLFLKGKQAQMAQNRMMNLSSSQELLHLKHSARAPVKSIQFDLPPTGFLASMHYRTFDSFHSNRCHSQKTLAIRVFIPPQELFRYQPTSHSFLSFPIPFVGASPIC